MDVASLPKTPQPIFTKSLPLDPFSQKVFEKDPASQFTPHNARGIGYPLEAYPPPQHYGGGYPYPPLQPMAGYGGYPYGPYPPPYSFQHSPPPPPPALAHGYAPPMGYPSTENVQKKKKKKSGMSKILGLGAGLVGGVVGGLLLGDLAADVGAAALSFESFSDGGGGGIDQLCDASIQSASESIDFLGTIG